MAQVFRPNNPLKNLYKKLSYYIKHEDDCPALLNRKMCECGATMDREDLRWLLKQVRTSMLPAKFSDRGGMGR